MAKVLSLFKVRMHPYADCTDANCGWSRPSAVTTRNSAKHHVSTTGHEVLVIVEDRTFYGPNND